MLYTEEVDRGGGERAKSEENEEIAHDNCMCMSVNFTSGTYSSNSIIALQVIHRKLLKKKGVLGHPCINEVG